MWHKKPFYLWKQWGSIYHRQSTNRTKSLCLLSCLFYRIWQLIKMDLEKEEHSFTFSVVTHVKTIISYFRLLFLFQRDTKFCHVTQRVNISQNVRIPSEWQSMHDHEESQLVSTTMYPIIKCWRDLLWMPGDLNQNFSYFWYEWLLNILWFTHLTSRGQ
jgi:hypothetical protein